MPARLPVFARSFSLSIEGWTGCWTTGPVMQFEIRIRRCILLVFGWDSVLCAFISAPAASGCGHRIEPRPWRRGAHRGVGLLAYTSPAEGESSGLRPLL